MRLTALEGNALLAAAAYLTGVLCASCGGGSAQVSAETARVSACQGVEQSIEDSDADLNTKIDRLRCVRAVCDALHERIVEESEQ